MAQKAGEWHQCHKCSTGWFTNVLCRPKYKQEKEGIKKATRSKRYLLKLMNLRGNSEKDCKTIKVRHHPGTPTSTVPTLPLTSSPMQPHTNHFRVRLINSISELHSYVVPSVCAMAASSTTFSLLNHPTICTLCNECQETLFHSLCTAMPTTIRILRVSSLCGLSFPPVSTCYHAGCERLATTGAQRGNVFGFCHHYTLLENVYVYNTYTLQYILLQYNVFF